MGLYYFGSAVTAIAVGTVFLTIVFRRLIAAGRGWVVAVCVFLGAYLGLGFFLVGPICGFDGFERTAVGAYEQTCSRLLTPAFVIMFVSTAFFPLFLPFLALTIGSVLALPGLLVLAMWTRLRG